VRRALAAISFALFLLTAILVDHGSFHGVDQYAVDHWMPWLHPHRHGSLFSVGSLIVPETRPTLAGTLVALWTYPASVVPSGIVVAIVCRARGWLWPGVLWVAANVVELAGKEIVHRSALRVHDAGFPGFDHSLPSGHTLRSLVLALVVVAAWRRAWPVAAWAVTIPVALVLIGDHVPTDVVAGAFAFGGLALALPGDTWARADAPPSSGDA
jgi:membrane-associated phospholipid phosphatase